MEFCTDNLKTWFMCFSKPDFYEIMLPWQPGCMHHSCVQLQPTILKYLACSFRNLFYSMLHCYQHYQCRKFIKGLFGLSWIVLIHTGVPNKNHMPFLNNSFKIMPYSDSSRYLLGTLDYETRHT